MTQLIIATHSEYVLSSALQDSDNVLVIVLNQSQAGISQRRITSPSVLPTITAAEINYLAFNIPSTDYHIELYGNLQHKLGDLNVINTDSYIKAHNLLSSLDFITINPFECNIQMLDFIFYPIITV